MTPARPTPDTASRIRSAATALFARRGYAAVSMRDIAGEVGIQAGAIYLHFKGKEALLADLIETHLDDRHAAWWNLAVTGEPGDRLRAFTRFHIDYRISNAAAATIEETDLRCLSDGVRAEAEHRRMAYVAELTQILDDGQSSREFNLSDTGLTAGAMIALMNGVASGYDPDGGLRQDQLGRICWRLIRRMAGPDQRAQPIT